MAIPINIPSTFMSPGGTAQSATVPINLVNSTNTNKLLQEQHVQQINWPPYEDSNGKYTQPYKGQVEEYGSFKLVPLDAAKTSKGRCLFDVVNNFKWTYSKYRDEVPRIKLIEKQITSKQQSTYYANIASKLGTLGARFNGSGLADPYAGMYDGENTGFEYIFPYYSSTAALSKSQWTSKVPADADFMGNLPAIGTIAKTAIGGAEIVAAATVGGMPIAAALDVLRRSIPDGKGAADKTFDMTAKAYAVAAGGAYAGIEQPQYFSNTSKNSYIVKFPLFNTDSMADIRRNYDLIKVFQYQNLLNRRTIATYDPPVIYLSEHAPANSGGYHTGSIGIKLLYVTNFTVNNLGAIRSIKIQPGSSFRTPIPDAWEVSIEFTELLSNSRHLHSSIITGKSIVNIQ